MRDAGLWLEFAPRLELDTWLQSADAFLVPMVFEEKYRRRMETSFPSKLIEFAQFGKPLIIWGPEYCSAVDWTTKIKSAICVTAIGAEELMSSVEKIKQSYFNPDYFPEAGKKSSQKKLDEVFIHNSLKTLLSKII
jgi:hypothetical protein